MAVSTALLLAVLAFIIYGPERLVRLARAVGSAIKARWPKRNRSRMQRKSR